MLLLSIQFGWFLEQHQRILKLAKHCRFLRVKPQFFKVQTLQYDVKEL